jgi:hypothetical protein
MNKREITKVIKEWVNEEDSKVLFFDYISERLWLRPEWNGEEDDARLWQILQEMTFR